MSDLSSSSQIRGAPSNGLSPFQKETARTTPRAYRYRTHLFPERSRRSRCVASHQRPLARAAAPSRAV